MTYLLNSESVVSIFTQQQNMVVSPVQIMFMHNSVTMRKIYCVMKVTTFKFQDSQQHFTKKFSCCCMNCSELVIDMHMTLARTLWVILCCQSLMLGLSASLRL